MTPVKIAVRGAHAVTVRPEQATVHATVSAEGPEAEPVFRTVSDSVARVNGSLQSRLHHRRGPVVRFAVDQIRMGSRRPFNPDGTQLPLVHTAAVSATATFTDFDDLAEWVNWCAGVEGLGIGHIDWSLRDVTRAKLERKARQKAVRDAGRRARDYADALDLGPVRVLSISDSGLGGPVQRKVMLAASAAPGVESGALSLRPGDVEVAAEVEAVFTVSAGD